MVLSPPDPNLPRQPGAGEPLDHHAVRDLLLLAARFGLMAEAETAARAIADHPEQVAPERVIPAALAELRQHRGVNEAAPYRHLWRTAADALLARSSTPPEAPRDWTIRANLPCDCEHCAALRAFCRDPVARKARFPLRKDLRRHLHREIDRHRLDLTHVTERRGSPYTLICTKTRDSHNRRLSEYAEDVSHMRSLLRSSPAAGRGDALSSRVRRLTAAVEASPARSRPVGPSS